MSLVLGYWGIRGRAQVTRLLCAYTGIQWQEKTYTSPEDWFGKDKQQLGILFPNLPYIVDGDVKISESDILPRYVIKKSGKTQLLGKDFKDSALIDNVIYVILDLWNPIIQLFFNKKWQDEKTGVFYKLKSKFDKLEKFINGKSTTLGYLTLADFFISEFSFYFEKLFPQEYKKYKSMQKIRQTVEQLQEVKEYYTRSDAIQAAFLPPNLTIFPFFLQKLNPKIIPSVPILSQKLSSTSQRKVDKKQVIINNGQKLKILLISSSLRKQSTNTGLLRACVQLNNPHFQYQWAQIDDLPFFNEDIQKQGTPQPVQRLRNQVQNSHGILFAVTQNNYSISAVLKNAYDWLSRNGDKSKIYEIPAAIVSSGGGNGGLNAQKAFRAIAQYCKVKFMNKPEIALKRYSAQYFDQQGNLIDETARQQLKQFLQHVAIWVDNHKKSK